MAAPEARSTGSRPRTRSSQSIIGFTEAELGLFLAILFLGLNFIGRQSGFGGDRREPTRPPDSTRTTTDPKLTELVALAARVDSMQAVLRTALTRDSLATSRVVMYERTRDSLRALRSPTPPVDRRGQDFLRTGTVADRERTVERALAVALLSRDTSRAALRAAQRTTDSLRALVAGSANAVFQARGVQAAVPTGTVAAVAQPRGGAGGGIRPGAGPAGPGGAPPTPPRGAGGGPVYVGAAVPGAGGDPGSPGAPGRGTPGVGIRSASALAGAGFGRRAGRGIARSSQTPTCVELGAARAAIADVTILGRDRYQVRDSVGTLQTLLAVLAPERERARRLECRHRVRVASGAALPADEYVDAVNALLPYFDTELVRNGPP